MSERASGSCGEGREETPHRIVELVEARCVVCGIGFEYPKGRYEPKTCKDADCVRKYLHPELSRREVMST